LKEHEFEGVMFQNWQLPNQARLLMPEAGTTHTTLCTRQAKNITPKFIELIYRQINHQEKQRRITTSLRH